MCSRCLNEAAVVWWNMSSTMQHLCPECDQKVHECWPFHDKNAMVNGCYFPIPETTAWSSNGQWKIVGNFQLFPVCVCMYIYIFIYICRCVYVCVKLCIFKMVMNSDCFHFLLFLCCTMCGGNCEPDSILPNTLCIVVILQGIDWHVYSWDILVKINSMECTEISLN